MFSLDINLMIILWKHIDNIFVKLNIVWFYSSDTDIEKSFKVLNKQLNHFACFSII